jgi:bacillolysin
MGARSPTPSRNEKGESMTSPGRTLAGAAAAAALACGAISSAQGPARFERLMENRPSARALRVADQQIDSLARAGQLRVRRVTDDTLIADREHERLDQYHRGVRVWGGDVTRQLRASGQTVSAFGKLYGDIDVGTSPAIDAAAARAIVSRETAGGAVATQPELVILPQERDTFTLAWRIRAMPAEYLDVREYFVDATSGRVVLEFSDLQTQAGVVGRGTGLLGDTKKVSVRPGSGGYITNDALRPPTSLITYDLKGDTARVLDYLNGRLQLGASDIAFDSDNDWTDGAIVDAHAYTGLTYDYLWRRFNRRGLNDNNIVTRAIVHPAGRNSTASERAANPLFFANATYYGGGLVIYGVGLPAGVTSGGRSWNHTVAAIDIVAHELTHGVTGYSSGLIYRNESGALNESFSDIIATAVEFYFQQPGSGNQRADYLAGEDAVKPSGIRSLEDPGMFGHPDHYSRRVTGTADNGGVHTNSGISNHAFFLAIEGGTNRTSGLSVQGVGPANREQIERVFYRAFTLMLPADATFSIARAATIQAARDLYGDNGNVERAVTQAWTAVGVQ